MPYTNSLYKFPHLHGNPAALFIKVFVPALQALFTKLSVPAWRALQQQVTKVSVPAWQALQQQVTKVSVPAWQALQHCLQKFLYLHDKPCSTVYKSFCTCMTSPAATGYKSFCTCVTSPAATVIPPTLSMKRPSSLISLYSSIQIGWDISSSTTAFELRVRHRGCRLMTSPELLFNWATSLVITACSSNDWWCKITWTINTILSSNCNSLWLVNLLTVVKLYKKKVNASDLWAQQQ